MTDRGDLYGGYLSGEAGDPADPLSLEPRQLSIGDTLEFERDLANFDPADGWSVTYHFQNASGSVGSVVGVDNGSGGWTFTVAAATTATWTAGRINYEAYATKGAERRKVAWGWFTATANFATATGVDTRSHAEKVLALIEATIEGTASKDQMAYTIGDRSLSRIPKGELLKFRDSYRREVEQEKRRDQIRKGGGHRGRVRVRFSR